MVGAPWCPWGKTARCRCSGHALDLGVATILVGADKFVVGGILRTNIRRFVRPCPQVFSAVVSYPIIRLANRRQERAIGQFEVSEGVAACYIGFLVLVFDIVDSDSHHSIATIPAFEDFVLNPFTTRGFRSDQNHSHTGIRELVVDPALNRGVTLFLDGLPVRSIDKAVLILARNDV